MREHGCRDDSLTGTLPRLMLIVVLGVAARSAQAQSDPTESERSHRIELLADLDEGSLTHWKVELSCSPIWTKEVSVIGKSSDLPDVRVGIES
jgi:hypothetical protein